MIDFLSFKYKYIKTFGDLAGVLPFISLGLGFITVKLINIITEHEPEREIQIESSSIENQQKIEVPRLTKKGNETELKTTMHMTKGQSNFQSRFVQTRAFREEIEKSKQQKVKKQIDASMNHNLSRTLNISQNIQNLSHIVDMTIFNSEVSEIDSHHSHNHKKTSKITLPYLIESELVLGIFIINVAKSIDELMILYLCFFIYSLKMKFKLKDISELDKRIELIFMGSNLIFLFCVFLNALLDNILQNRLVSFFFAGMLLKQLFLGGMDKIFNKKGNLIRNLVQSTVGFTIGCYFVLLR